MPTVTIKETDHVYVTARDSGETVIGRVVEIEAHEDGSTTIYVDTDAGSRLVLGIVPHGAEYGSESAPLQ